MNILQMIDDFDSKGMLKPALKAGLISTKWVRQREMVVLYQSFVDSGNVEVEAKKMVADTYGVDLMTVRRAIKAML